MTPEDSEALPSPVLERLEALGTTLDAIASRLQGLSDRERRTRQVTVGLAVSFALDIALTIVVTILTITAVHQSSSVHTAQMAACTITNQTRADEITLWGYVISLSQKGSKPTPQSETQIAQFKAFIGKTFAPENCARLYP